MKVGCMPFTASLALSILEGRKTQTRRVIPDRLTCNADIDKNDPTYFFVEDQYGDWEPGEVYAPYQAGDILWIREPGRVVNFNYFPLRVDVEYNADQYAQTVLMPERLLKEDGLAGLPRWASETRGIPNGIFKEAARLFVKITDVYVERVGNISKKDALAEGLLVHSTREGDSFHWDKDVHSDNWFNWPDTAFEKLWDSTSKPGFKWADNPFVWVYQFERTDKPANWPGN